MTKCFNFDHKIDNLCHAIETSRGFEKKQDNHLQQVNICWHSITKLQGLRFMKTGKVHLVNYLSDSDVEGTIFKSKVIKMRVDINNSIAIMP